MGFFCFLFLIYDPVNNSQSRQQHRTQGKMKRQGPLFKKD